MNAKKEFVGFDVLKRSVSMVQVLDRYGLLERLQRSGDSLTGVCPLHQGHNPTQFRVSTAKNCWICFGDCHGGGSIIDFVSRKERIGIREAALLIQDWFGVQPNGSNGGQSRTPRQPQAEPDRHRMSQERSEPSHNAPLQYPLARLDGSHPYLAQRGLTPETIATFGIGYCAHGLLGGWIAIPIHNASGQLLAYAARWPGQPPNGQPKYRLPKGFRKSLELFNLHRALTADARLPLVVVEGFFGCMRLWQAEHHRVVALMGSMLSEAQEELILKAASPTGRVILLFDEDEAGRKGRAEARMRLARWLHVNAVQFAKEGTQPEDLTAEEVAALLGGAP